MAKMSKFPSIEQYRNVCRHVHDATRYKGRNADNSPNFDPNIPLPVLKFRGTVKLHGTNSGIGYYFNNPTDYWCQSRENIITPEKDNAGFATFVYSKRDVFFSIFDNVTAWLLQNGYDLSKYEGAVIYGEWCGGNIQSGVSINGLPKMLVVFHIKLLAIDTGVEQDDANEERIGNLYLPEAAVMDTIGYDSENHIYNTYHFDNYEIEIDFNEPEQKTNELIAITDAVEKCCPVGKHFGNEGIGEGVVWVSVTPPYTGGNYMFKVKGEKHSSSKVKKTASVDIEKVASIKECVEQIVTENRLRQGLEHMTMNGLAYTPENTGAFLKWVANDCIKEELDTIIGSGLEVKEVSGAISRKAREWYFATTQTSLL